MIEQSSNAVVEVNGLVKSFKDVKAVRGVSVSIEQGEFVALLGPNGAGKTTLIEMIEGIQSPDSGTIKILGKEWRGNEEYLHANIGLSLQETRFIDKLRVGETLNLFASFYKLDKSRVDEVLTLVNLVEKRKAYVQNLSGGQRQRLALGIALLNEPKLLLLDEPTTGLDPTARREIWDILSMLKETLGTTMILTTHYMDEASYLCDRIIIMDQGEILVRGTLEELLKEHEDGQIVGLSFIQPIPNLKFDDIEGVSSISGKMEGDDLRLRVQDVPKQLPLIMERISSSGGALDHLEVHSMTLDDLFISMTGRTLGAS